MKETTASIEEKSTAIVNNSEEKTKSGIDISRSNEDKAAVMLAIEQLSNCNAELHQSCDFVMKKLKIRHNVCDEEITPATRRLRPSSRPRRSWLVQISIDGLEHCIAVV